MAAPYGPSGARSLAGHAVGLETGRPQDQRERRLRSRPGVAHPLRAAAANHEPQRKAEDDSVVQLTDSWEEVRDQVERQGEIAEHDEEDGTATRGDSLVAGQSRDQHRAIRDEPGERARILAAPG